MKQLPVFILMLHFACTHANELDVKRYKQQAARVTIHRDNWGVPHVYGKTDADAVFGVMYAQCEDSFESVEENYIERLGRMSELKGEEHLYDDLKMRLLYDSAAAITDYRKSPEWLRKLLIAFADGINYYIYLHPSKPVLLSHFEPWYPLMFTDGGYTATQTGGLTTEDIKRLYNPGSQPGAAIIKSRIPVQLDGSNAFAIAPKQTANGNALLYINPHVSFYFRTEMHMVSEEGLNAYGAVTWGQFFVFQGFNENCGWMHTSSMADAADLYLEKVVNNGEQAYYQYNGEQKKVGSRKLTINYKSDFGTKPFQLTTYYTHHGPVFGKRDNHWLSLKEQNRSLNGLIQSWQRTKSKNITEFKKALSLFSNSSTNTMYADRDGNIAYWHGNFVPVRDSTYDWSEPVDGSVAATEWKGAHNLDEVIHFENPVNGWLQNCNSMPYTASGYNAIPIKSFPLYMAPDQENFRSAFAIKMLQNHTSWTADNLVAMGYNNYLPAFDSMLPPLFAAYETLPASDGNKQLLQAPIALLKQWDKKAAINSVAATIAIEWGLTLLQYQYKQKSPIDDLDDVQLYTGFVRRTPPELRLAMLINVLNSFKEAFGTWEIPWGEINRYQRISTNREQHFSDSKPSIPVGIGSSIFGSLPSFETSWPGTRKGYGVGGNSFVAVVEFGKRLMAKSIVTGGQSFDPASKHFDDQTAMFLSGKMKDVYYYKEDLQKHTEKSYHPGND